MSEAFHQVLDAIGRRWCYYMHPDPMWPVNGVYRCPECQRTFPVPWGGTVEERFVQSAPKPMAQIFELPKAG